MTYLYEITSGPDTGTTIEVEHSISAPKLTTLEHNGQTVNVRRLIASPGGFILKGGNWCRDGYSVGIQNQPTKEDRANFGKKP